MFVSKENAHKSRFTRLAHEKEVFANIVWFDAEANMWELASDEGVRQNVANCAEANANAIVVDVKPLSGHVFYKSDIAPRLCEFAGKKYPDNHDLLQSAVEAARECGLKIYANVNVFSEGSQLMPGGPAFTHKDWQCLAYTTDGLLPQEKTVNVHNAIFVSPTLEEVQEYELAIIREICSRYPVDGIVLDRMRYANIFCDFSPAARIAFETYIGEKVGRWPEDILKRTENESYREGPLFYKWIYHRADIIKKFAKRVREAVKDKTLGVYVGSWYPVYYDVGVNWGSETHVPGYPWWPAGYEKTGYAELFDFICTGCYYPCVSRVTSPSSEEEWKTVEAACEESVHAVKDATFVYGSLYLREYEDRPDVFTRAVEKCYEITQGCMYFDLVYLRNYNWWHQMQSAAKQSIALPHEIGIK